MPTTESRAGSGSTPTHWLRLLRPDAKAWSGSRDAVADRTRASHAAHADWERTPTLKRAVGDQEKFVLTLRFLEGVRRIAVADSTGIGSNPRGASRWANPRADPADPLQ